MIDATQWALLTKFKAAVSTTQFYKMFLSVSDLKANVEKLLDLAARDYARIPSSLTAEITLPVPPNAVDISVEDEVGFFEAQELFVTTMSDLGEFATSITQMLDSLNLVTTKATEQLTTLGRIGDNSLPSRKTIVDKLGTEISNLTEHLKLKLASYEPARRNIASQLAIYMDLMTDFNDPDSEHTFVAGLNTAANTLDDTLEQLRSLRNTLGGVARLTSKFRKSRAELILMLDAIDTYHSDLLVIFRESAFNFRANAARRLNNLNS